MAEYPLKYLHICMRVYSIHFLLKKSMNSKNPKLAYTNASKIPNFPFDFIFPERFLYSLKDFPRKSHSIKNIYNISFGIIPSS